MLINLRNALMAGKRLPYDAEVEYLEGTGTQYIDTGCNADGDLFWTITARATQRTQQRMGAIQLSPTILRNHLSVPEAYNELTDIGYGQSVFGYKYSADFGTHVLQIEQSGSLVLAKIDGTQFGSSDKSQFDIGANFFLFARNDKTAIIYGRMIVFAAQFFRGNIMIRDFIPVRKGTVGYLYDRVSGKLFGNAGTGDFVLGPDVVPVEYIESHGTEYIDTGVYGSQNLRTTFDYQLVYSGTAPVAKGLFGCYANGMAYHLYCSGAAPSAFQVGMGSTYVNTIRVDNVRHSIEFNNSAVSIDGNAVATFEPSGTPTAHTLLLFALHNTSGGLYSMTPMRKWRVQMWDNGTPVRSFLPVRVGTEGAMMDVLTRRIYRNAGSGAFTYGNDLKYPIPSE